MKAYPLFLNDPFFSIWTGTPKLNDSDTIFWTGGTKRTYGILKVDGKSYSFMGCPEGMEKMEQKEVSLSLFRTDYLFSADEADLKVSFFSPLPMNDLKLMSMPTAYLEYEILPKKPIGKAEVVLTISEDWCHIAAEHQEMRGDVFPTEHGEVGFFGLERQEILNRSGDRIAADWGYYFIRAQSCYCHTIPDFQDVGKELTFDAEAGKEEAKVATDGAAKYDTNVNTAVTSIGDAITNTATYDLKLQSGKEYTAEDIEKILAEAGLDIDVELSGVKNHPDAPNTLMVTNKDATAVTLTLAGGTGLGDEDAFLNQANYDTSAATGGMTLQVGANEGQTISFNINDMSALSLGVNGTNVRVDDQDKAAGSISAIDGAIEKVSKQRSALGAIQNRLEHTIANLDVAAENLQTAESRIRDVDMAEEMVEYSKNNILSQASQSMLAQANQATQGVLSLLQG